MSGKPELEARLARCGARLALDREMRLESSPPLRAGDMSSSSIVGLLQMVCPACGAELIVSEKLAAGGVWCSREVRGE